MGYSYVLLGDLRFDNADKRQRWLDTVLTSTSGVRANALEVLAGWKVPGLVPLVIEHADRLGEVAAVRILTALGDPAAIPWLEQGLSAAKRKDQRVAFTRAIQKCGGAPPAGKQKPKKPKT